MFLRHAQPSILTRFSPKQKWPFSAFVGIIWDSFLSHVPRLRRPCRGVAATAGTGLAGLCNLTISILGQPQEMWPKVEGLSSFKPTWMGIITKWADSAVTLKAVWDNTIISCFVFLSSWVIYWQSGETEVGASSSPSDFGWFLFFFSVAGDQEHSGFTPFANTALSKLLWMASVPSVFGTDLD